jgi:hypothetical protein
MARQPFEGRGLIVEPSEGRMPTCTSMLPTEMLLAQVPMLPRDAHGCRTMPYRQEGCATDTVDVDLSADVPLFPPIPQPSRHLADQETVTEKGPG